jgi:acetyl esterase/lipase
MAKEHVWPCIVYVQGSAFHEQWIWNNIARHIRLAQKGYVIAIVQYRPSEVAPFPAQMQDAKTAIRFMRKHAAEYHVDPDHIAVAGDSSGGHTALMAGFTGDDEPDTDLYSEYSAKVNCIVDVYGPTVFALMNYYDSSQNHYDPESPEGFEIGQKNVLENLDDADATIPMNYLSEDKPTPPLLVIHGGRDMLVPFNQSVRLYECMKKLNKDVTFYKIDDANHGCLGWDNDTILDIVEKFLREHI